MLLNLLAYLMLSVGRHLTTVPTPSPRPPAARTTAPDGWLIRFLRDPWTGLHHVWTHACTWLIAWGPLAGPATAAVLVALVLAARWGRRLRQQRLTRGGGPTTRLADATAAD